MDPVSASADSILTCGNAAAKPHFSGSAQFGWLVFFSPPTVLSTLLARKAGRRARETPRLGQKNGSSGKTKVRPQFFCGELSEDSTVLRLLLARPANHPRASKRPCIAFGLFVHQNAIPRRESNFAPECFRRDAAQKPTNAIFVNDGGPAVPLRVVNKT